MEQVIRKNIYSTFILKCYLKKVFGNHAPFEIVSLISYFMHPEISVDYGSNHGLLLVDGKVYSWGSNKYGQLGLGHYEKAITPQKINLENIISIKCGSEYSLALDTYGNVYSWGLNSCGQLGIGDVPNQNSPRKINIQNIKIIDCSITSCMVLNTLGEIFVWGENDRCLLGISGDNIVDNPKKIPLKNIVSISIGENNLMATSESGDVYVWGNNFHSQLGLINTYDHQLIPQKLTTERINCVDKSIVNNIQTIIYGGFCSFILTKKGYVYSYGYTACGQLGIAQVDPDIDTEVKIQKLNIENVSKISYGFFNVVAMTTNNEIYAWGDNEYGKLGLDKYDSYTIPQKINLHNIIDIACGSKSSVFVSKYGEIYTCGLNHIKQLDRSVNKSIKKLSKLQKMSPIISYNWPALIERSVNGLIFVESIGEEFSLVSPTGKRSDKSSLIDTDDCHKKRKIG